MPVSLLSPFAQEEGRMRAVESLGLLDTPPETDFDEAVRLAASICNTPIGLMTIVDRHRQWFKAKIGLNISETPRDQAFCAHAIQGDGPLIIRDAQEDSRFVGNPLVTGNPNIRFYAGIPLHTSDGYGIGTLCVIDTVPRELTPEQKTALTVLGHQISSQIELRTRNKLMHELILENERIAEKLRDANAQLHELSLTDTLTRLRNRRAFDERLDQEIELAQTTGTPLCILLVDIDRFKAINDDFGHLVGDDMLCMVARILVRTSRNLDLVSRHGGEEFAIVLPSTGIEGAKLAAERLRAAVESFNWVQRPLTVSIGVAAWNPSMQDRFSLFEAVDTALYSAKTEGRNRVAVI